MPSKVTGVQRRCRVVGSERERERELSDVCVCVCVHKSLALHIHALKPELTHTHSPVHSPKFFVRTDTGTKITQILSTDIESTLILVTDTDVHSP